MKKIAGNDLSYEMKRMWLIALVIIASFISGFSFKSILTKQNELKIKGQSKYMNTGEGLHRHVDPVDNEIYIYTQFEVADCRRVFPVFEQPDIKGTLALTVTAPSKWNLISNSPTPTCLISFALRESRPVGV